MKFTASIIMALFSAASLVAANPTPADPVLEARGHGCPGSSNQCAFHCRNDVVKNCSNGNKLKPVGGTCGGVFWATCKCVYDRDC